MSHGIIPTGDPISKNVQINSIPNNNKYEKNSLNIIGLSSADPGIDDGSYTNYFLGVAASERHSI